ncbi:MAG: arginase family protein, partial [Microthrixaceae bacterium]|nr:arginase family protein [Microthrixaceae bacterium]
MFRLGIDATVDRIREVVGGRAAYLTVDIDFLDPAYAPGTGTPVVGGPTTWQARQILFGLRGLDVVGADLVEVAPAYDPSGQITALAGATLAHDELHLLAEARDRRR